MDARVARNAVLKLRLREVMEPAAGFGNTAEARAEAHHIVVTFKAQCEHRRTPQQTRVRAAMRIVT